MLARYRQTGLFLLEHLDHGFLVVICELCRVEVGRLALENMLGQLEHIGLELHVRNVVEVFFRVPKLVGIAQCGSISPLSQGWSMITRAGCANTTRPGATTPFPRMAPRTTAKASWPAWSFGMM